MATHSSTLAWKIPWTEEPGRLQSMGSLRVGHDWATSLSFFTFHFSLSCIGEGNGNPLQCSCLENPRDGGAWWAAIYGVAQSQTLLKWLSSSSSNIVVKASLVAQTVKICLQWRRLGFDQWVGKILWRREWLPTSVFLPREFHGQRSLEGYSPWGRESDTSIIS